MKNQLFLYLHYDDVHEHDVRDYGYHDHDGNDLFE